MRKLILAVVILLAVASPVTWWLLRNYKPGPTSTVAAPVQPVLDSTVPIAGCKHASVGWSTADSEIDAVRQSVAMALHRLDKKKPNFAFVTLTTGYNVETVREELDRVLPPEVKIHGLTSGIAVMTQEGFHTGKVGSMAIMFISDDSEIRFGTGAVKAGGDGNLEALGAESIRKAIADAGMPAGKRPDIILYAGSPRRGAEMRIFDGIAEVVGSDVPILGGSVGWDVNAKSSASFTRQQVYSDGWMVTVLYTDRMIGWAYECGFRETDTTGVITKANEAGNIIYEIDGRPALDVYNKWLNGKLIPVIETESFETITGFTACNPISRRQKGQKGQIGYIVAEAIPTRENLKDRSLPVYSYMPEGSTIRLLAGRWQNLLNRAEQASTMALMRGGNRADNIEFGLLNFCWAASQSIPASELPKIPLLVRNKIPQTPFIGMFTDGEPGPLPGMRNVYCNLAASMVLVEQEKKATIMKEPPSEK